MYKIYFISCGENISIFTRATHSWKYWFFHRTRWNIFGIHLHKVNILYLFHGCENTSRISRVKLSPFLLVLRTREQYWFFHRTRWNIFGIHLHKVNILYLFHGCENTSCISRVKFDVRCFLHWLPWAHFRFSNACITFLLVDKNTKSWYAFS